MTANPPTPAAAEPSVQTTSRPLDDHAEAAAERARLSYEGHRLPALVILVWIAFFVFGLAYFVRHLT